MSAPVADTAEVPVVRSVAPALLPGVSFPEVPTFAPAVLSRRSALSQRRRERRERRQLAVLSLLLLALVLGATIIVLDMVR